MLHQNKIRICISIDQGIVDEIEKRRGLIPFSTKMNAMLKAELQRENEGKS